MDIITPDSEIPVLYNSLLLPPNETINIPTDALDRILKYMHSYWFDADKDIDDVKCAMNLFDIQKEPHELETTDIENGYNHALFRWLNLQFLFRNRSLIDDSSSDRNVLFSRIANCMLVNRQILDAKLSRLKIYDPTHDSG